VRLEAQHIDGPSVEKHLIERGYRVMHMCVGSGEESGGRGVAPPARALAISHHPLPTHPHFRAAGRRTAWLKLWQFL